jgi:hypothetical protein
MTDIALTWPQTRSLASYVLELDKARQNKQVVNFRVHILPTRTPVERCYMVHEGFVCGWMRVRRLVHHNGHSVRDPITGQFWPAGYYIVRSPVWHPLNNGAPMKGFQGFRYVHADAMGHR